ncbi:hypothetical protein [Rubricoccus marinus]|uniref:Uncharacterized protein n=1 Tax=Rubricoccus marinus TaxID=716817 RepID=A0A259U2V9_9BACT|nr:hypothetical protein [Rubricoccus marinus]OZC04187.1 hypothetical protein BSZ36_15075 [Rubricoccus marinus]
MDPGLHVKQAINHLNKIVQYVPFVVEDGDDGPTATVALTPEDWGVVADALFHMDTPKEVFPDSIADYRMDNATGTIRLDLQDGTAVTVEAG